MYSQSEQPLEYESSECGPELKEFFGHVLTILCVSLTFVHLSFDLGEKKAEY